MIYVVVSVRDRALDAFGRPLFVAGAGVAIRSFQDEINRAAEDNPMYKHPDDYDLYRLGEFDEASGRFVNAETPELMALGKQLVTGR